MDEMYKKIKKQNGERFAQHLRRYHNGLLQIPDIDQIVRHAGRDAEPLLPYLMSLLAANDNAPAAPTQDPIALLDQAGYNAFYADTLEAQNSIKKYFAPGEILCTFNDSARHKNYHIVHAVKKDVDNIRREDFRGKEERQDPYGTSVISIQMLKTGGFISIKNRYNHAVNSCDNTFNSNPDNIIDGLSRALKHRFKVDFSKSSNNLPEGFVLNGISIFKYHQETNNTYYGDQAYMKDGVIHEVNRAAGDALFGIFLFDNKSKLLKKIDPDVRDSFADDFNRDYGGNRQLSIQGGSLVLNREVLIGAENSSIKTLCLPTLTTMGDYCLHHVPALTRFEAPALTTMGKFCLGSAPALREFKANALTTMDSLCLYNAPALTQFEARALTAMENDCLYHSHALIRLETPALIKMGDNCIHYAAALTQFETATLTTMGAYTLTNAPTLTQFKAPSLTTMGRCCLNNTLALTQFEAPSLADVPSYLQHIAGKKAGKSQPVSPAVAAKYSFF